MKNFLIITILFCAYASIFAQNKEQLLTMKSNLSVNSIAEDLTLPNESFNKKSPALAILYSMILPGMGELYAGDYSTGKYFTIADGLLWGVFTGITIYGNNKEDDYKAFATAFGGIDISGKDDEYFANIGIYENIDEYNKEKELNREFEEVYNETTHYWNWDDNDQRKEYRSLWTSSENAKNNVRFAVGALILNRIVSSIFAVRAVAAHNRQEKEKLSWNMSFGANENPILPAQLNMKFRYNFNSF